MRLLSVAVCVGLIAFGLAACGNSPSEFMRPPAMSPVGTGLMQPDDAVQRAVDKLSMAPRVSTAGAVNLYSDQKISNVGEIVTVVISINDKATFGNESDRSATSGVSLSGAFGFSPPTSGSGSSSSQPGTATASVNSTSTSTGSGDINRSEQIQVSVPAVVTRVLPNGNLVIRGSQEVRVNFEMRQLAVAGVVNPSDISRNNTIAYDRVAEARISYGGRGRVSDVQQPAWGQQIYDYVNPF
jgi:flagellar L-ring protein FlgH